VIPSGSDALRIGRKSGILRFIKLKKKEIKFFKAGFLAQIVANRTARR
jgi:hypothetical protein